MSRIQTPEDLRAEGETDQLNSSGMKIDLGETVHHDVEEKPRMKPLTKLPAYEPLEKDEEGREITLRVPKAMRAPEQQNFFMEEVGAVDVLLFIHKFIAIF